jgi:hypothetical protein
MKAPDLLNNGKESILDPVLEVLDGLFGIGGLGNIPPNSGVHGFLRS